MYFRIYKLGETFKVVFFKYGLGNPADEDDFLYEGIGINDKKLDNNLCRAKTRIKELALCNDWSHFVTLTLDGEKINRYDLDGFIKKLGYWIRNYNRKYSANLKYELIPEQHKDKAWHLHGLMNGLAPESLVKNKNGYLDMPYYREHFGYISLSPIKDRKKIASYITKYVAKALQATAIKLCKHSFYHSQGLLGAKLIHEDYTGFIPENVWTNEFVGIQHFDSQEELTDFIFKMQEKDKEYEYNETFGSD